MADIRVQRQNADEKAVVELSGIEPLTSSLRRGPGEFPQNSTAFFIDYESMI